MDYSPIEAFLVGRCGLTQEQAGYVGMIEYRQRVEGFEQRYREEWEIARWQMFMIQSMHPFMKPAQKRKTPQSFYPFPWEKQRIPEAPEGGWRVKDDEVKKLNAIVENYIKKHGQDR